MRHRFTVALYDEYPVEAEILDYLVPYGRGKRQEVLRMLVKAGYAAMMQHKDASSAMMGAVDPDALALLVQALSGQQGLPAQAAPAHHTASQAGQQTPPNAPRNNSYEPGTPVDESRSDQSSNHSRPDGQPSKRPDFDAMAHLEEDEEESGMMEFEPEEENPEHEGDGDLEDPMKKLMNM